MKTTYQKELENVIPCRLQGDYTSTGYFVPDPTYHHCSLEKRGGRLVLWRRGEGEFFSESASAVREILLYVPTPWQRALDYARLCFLGAYYCPFGVFRLLTFPLLIPYFLLTVWFTLPRRLVMMVCRTKRDFDFHILIEPNQSDEAIRKLQIWDLPAKIKNKIKKRKG